ncbi:hypothetical protein SAMN02745244_00341 [Tessaracoccus bendigoensis DSM 12906]|uniref:Uncharacterized protein n=1 Tax=Tessaracoccus bendigoensis DSM 12906 TaxID=1123357 RepID=A0A1M6B503_9ACTN|nr:hypothetical protein SAMN02745244_00341 [Tessaracoccus bendigoensis DSM 12906]
MCDTYWTSAFNGGPLDSDGIRHGNGCPRPDGGPLDSQSTLRWVPPDGAPLDSRSTPIVVTTPRGSARPPRRVQLNQAVADTRRQTHQNRPLADPRPPTQPQHPTPPQAVADTRRQTHQNRPLADFRQSRPWTRSWTSRPGARVQIPSDRNANPQATTPTLQTETPTRQVGTPRPRSSTRTRARSVARRSVLGRPTTSCSRSLTRAETTQREASSSAISALKPSP